jgi:hypothetical protein
LRIQNRNRLWAPPSWGVADERHPVLLFRLDRGTRLFLADGAGADGSVDRACPVPVVPGCSWDLRQEVDLVVDLALGPCSGG